ncbi:MAG: hypothetical protein KI790_00960 [Cyclobacteriaceae bacterium]|nr:hypothetical protein [Cyclobacteriaceae bacterium HetDA_MAG_MS6]
MIRRRFLKGLLGSLASFLTGSVMAYGKECTTSSDDEGPYFKQGAPFREQIFDEAPENQEVLLISGFIKSDCHQLVGDGVVDVWQAGPNKRYDLSDQYQFRGKVRIDSKGFYQVKTLVPPIYPGRPMHIHFKVSAKGYQTLTTQMYFSDDESRHSDWLYRRNDGASRSVSIDRSEKPSRAQFDIFLKSNS